MYDRMVDSVLDLFLGSCCTVCGRPGRLLCRPCTRSLPRRGEPSWPTPCPEGLVMPTTAGPYEGPLKLLVNGHKERGQFALARSLGDLLALAVLVHVTRTSRPAGGPPTASVPWLLVPVPSRGSVVRSRGHDPLVRVALRAACRLRARGVDVRVGRLLRSSRATQDQAGLGAGGRYRNLAGSMTCRRGRAARLAAAQRRPGAPHVLVVDDVVTTGATLREAQRALEAEGVRVAGAATVAATTRRLPPPSSRTVAPS